MLVRVLLRRNAKRSDKRPVAGKDRSKGTGAKKSKVLCTEIVDNARAFSQSYRLSQRLCRYMYPRTLSSIFVDPHIVTQALLANIAQGGGGSTEGDIGETTRTEPSCSCMSQLGGVDSGDIFQPATPIIVVATVEFRIGRSDEVVLFPVKWSVISKEGDRGAVLYFTDDCQMFQPSRERQSNSRNPLFDFLHFRLGHAF